MWHIYTKEIVEGYKNKIGLKLANDLQFPLPPVCRRKNIIAPH